MFQSLQSPHTKRSQLVALQVKLLKHDEAIESSIQCAQHVPLQPEYYRKGIVAVLVINILANIYEYSMRQNAQPVVAEINFNKVIEAPEKIPFQPPPGHCCSGQSSSDHWDSERQFFEVFSTGCPARKVASSYWDFERLEVEELPTDSMPSSSPRVFPNCQNCVHRESSNYCWIGQGDWDVSIPSKLQAKMKSTCCVAGKALEASQSHRKLHPTCATCSLAAWGLLGSNRESNPSQHL